MADFWARGLYHRGKKILRGPRSKEGTSLRFGRDGFYRVRKKKPKQTPKEDNTADVVVQTLCNVLISEETVNGLISTWAANFSGEGVDILALKKANSEHYANLVEHRNEKLKALLGAIASEDTLSNSVNSAGTSLKAIKAIDESEFEDIRSLFTARKLSIKESQNGVD